MSLSHRSNHRQEACHLSLLWIELRSTRTYHCPSGSFFKLSATGWSALYDRISRLADTNFVIIDGQYCGDYLLLTMSLGPFLIMMPSPSSRLHSIRGLGCPVAWQVRVAFSPSCTDMSELVSSFKISGGTATVTKITMSLQTTSKNTKMSCQSTTIKTTISCRSTLTKQQ